MGKRRALTTAEKARKTRNREIAKLAGGAKRVSAGSDWYHSKQTYTVGVEARPLFRLHRLSEIGAKEAKWEGFWQDERVKDVGKMEEIKLQIGKRMVDFLSKSGESEAPAPIVETETEQTTGNKGTEQATVESDVAPPAEVIEEDAEEVLGEFAPLCEEFVTEIKAELLAAQALTSINEKMAEGVRITDKIHKEIYRLNNSKDFDGCFDVARDLEHRINAAEVEPVVQAKVAEEKAAKPLSLRGPASEAEPVVGRWRGARCKRVQFYLDHRYLSMLEEMKGRSFTDKVEVVVEASAGWDLSKADSTQERNEGELKKKGARISDEHAEQVERLVAAMGSRTKGLRYAIKRAYREIKGYDWSASAGRSAVSLINEAREISEQIATLQAKQQGLLARAATASIAELAKRA